MDARNTVGDRRHDVDDKLMLNGKTSRPLAIRPDVFLFREFGGTFYPYVRSHCSAAKS